MSPAMARWSRWRDGHGILPSSKVDEQTPLLRQGGGKRKRCPIKPHRCAVVIAQLAVFGLICITILAMMGVNIFPTFASFLRQFSLLLLSLFAATNKAATFSPVLPPSYPLAVRNPYVSAWLPGNQAANLPTSQAQFWNTNLLTWSVIARVNGQAYNLFGVPNPDSGSQSATVVSGSYTSTHSVFVVTAGNAKFTLDFFSPVSPNNYVRQSLPYSYLTVTAVALSGKTPTVQVYSDIDDTWTGQSSSSSWTHSVTDGTSVFQLQAVGTAYYSQNKEMALWGKAVYASRAGNYSTLTASAGSASDVRGQFSSNGTLTDEISSWSSGAVVGFAHDLGKIDDSTKRPVTFAIGHYRERTVNYLGTIQTHYYRAKYPTIVGGVSHFLDDYDAAFAEAETFDSTVDDTATSIGGANYSDILALSVRQIFGGIDLTINHTTLDTSNPWAFIKEISSDGNVNTIDIIFPTFPFFYIFAPQYIKLFLEPVLKYVTSGRYNEAYLIHDIGFNYPNATGHDLSKEEKMPVEETGNLLILALAYQQATGDKSWASSYSSKFKGYADYLVANGLYPVNQLSTNDGLGAFTNMTNLGVKAAVGLAAYGELTGQSNYTTTGKSFAEKIWSDPGLGVATSDATSEKYFTITYADSTWFLLFNIFPDKLLGLDVFSNETYKAQSDFYPTVRDVAGVAMEGHVVWAKTDWQMWVAAVAEGSTTTSFINDLWAFVSNGLNTAPFGDRYWSGGTNAGHTAEGFRARPTLGGHFAVWAAKKGANSG